MPLSLNNTIGTGGHLSSALHGTTEDSLQMTVFFMINVKTVGKSQEVQGLKSVHHHFPFTHLPFTNTQTPSVFMTKKNEQEYTVCRTCKDKRVVG